MEWDEAQRAWFPRIDADFIANYQMSYGVEESGKSEPPAEEDAAQSSWAAWWSFYERLKSGVDADGKALTEEEKTLMEEQWQQFIASDAYRRWYQHYYANGNAAEATSSAQQGADAAATAAKDAKIDEEPKKKKAKKNEPASERA